jgi:hypothetical protein
MKEAATGGPVHVSSPRQRSQASQKNAPSTSAYPPPRQRPQASQKSAPSTSAQALQKGAVHVSAGVAKRRRPRQRRRCKKAPSTSAQALHKARRPRQTLASHRRKGAPSTWPPADDLVILGPAPATTCPATWRAGPCHVAWLVCMIVLDNTFPLCATPVKCVLCLSGSVT